MWLKREPRLLRLLSMHVIVHQNQSGPEAAFLVHWKTGLSREAELTSLLSVLRCQSNNGLKISCFLGFNQSLFDWSWYVLICHTLASKLDGIFSNVTVSEQFLILSQV